MTDMRARLESALGATYRIERSIGSGSMSHVYAAHDSALGRQVVVKVLSPALAASISVARFQQEIQLAASLQHPHIVPLLTAGEVDGLPFYTMPFVEGPSLRAHLESVGEMPIPEAVRLLRDIATALQYAHHRGVVHRDIKPENVLLTGGHAVVTDFGVAKALRAAAPDDNYEGLTSLGVALGTPAYMAPEQAAGEATVDHRADIYSLGVVAYEMLAGQPPFQARQARALLAAQINEVPKPVQSLRGSVPHILAALVMACLEKHPADRPQSAAEVIKVLDELSTPSAGTIPAWRSFLPGPRASRSRTLGWRVAITLAIAVTSFGAWRAWSSRRSPPNGIVSSSIAVLPFRNLSADSADQYFAEGITDAFTEALSRIPGLRVASRTSSFVVNRGRDLDIRQIGSRLNVGAVLEGAVRREGNQLHISAQLSNARDGLSVWANTFDRSMSDVFQLQDDLTRAIVSALGFTPPADRAQPLVKRGTSNLEAYDLYLRGRARFHTFEEGALRESIQFYDSALKKDSSFAEAWAGIAESWLFLADDYEPPRVAYPAAKAAAARALALDSSVSTAHAALGNALYAYDWNLTAGEREMQKALSLNPNDFVVMLSYQGLLIAKGQPDSALSILRQAKGIDPLSPIEALFLGRFYGITGRPHEAIAEYNRAQELEPGLAPPALIAIGEMHLAAGERAAAESSFAAARKMLGGQMEFLFAAGEASLGHRDAALRLVRALEDESRKRYVRPEIIAGVYVRLGDRDEAFRWLERAYEARSPYLLALKVDQQWEPLRGDRRYASLVKRLGIP
jgi:serine/threonine-protein kinase